MAKILYEVKKNTNMKSTAFGRWCAQIKSLETLNTRKLANSSMLAAGSDWAISSAPMGTGNRMSFPCIS